VISFLHIAPARMSTKFQDGLRAITSEPANDAVIRRFQRFFIAVALVPVAVYLASTVAIRKFVHLQYISGHGAASPPILAGIISIFSLNLLTGLFALGALREAPIVPNSTRADPKGDVDDSEGIQRASRSLSNAQSIERQAPKRE
jgi:hypothetical protein